MDTCQLDDLIKSCGYPPSQSGHPLDERSIGAFINGVTREEFCDIFSRHVASEYASRRLSFEAADAAMNRLWEYAFLGDECFLPTFSREVFEAFDAGEYYHSDDPPGTDPELKYTRPWVTALLEQGLRT